jgi:hypothetical protein
MKRNCDLFLAILMFFWVVASVIEAAVPMLLTHQGRLLDASDQPVTGTRDITFHIYETEIGGVPLWTEPHPDVPIDNGLFHVTLGGSVTISADLVVTTGPFDPGKWLEIQVEGTTLSPRMRLASVPYSVGTHRVSGDVETSPGQLQVSGMSGSTTATIRSSQNPGTEGSEIVLIDGSGSTTGTIRAASNTGGQVILSGHGGSTTGTIRMQVSPDSAVSNAGLDLNGDGVPDVATAMEAIASRNILKSYFETGDKPSQARFVTQYSESDMELSVTEVDELHTATVAADSTASELRLLQMPLGAGVSGTTSGKISVSHGSGGGGGGAGGEAFTVTGTFQDGTSEDVTEMKAARKDITINLRHSDLTGVEGDQTAAMAVDSFGSELRIGSGPLSGMSGSTTGTIRVGLTNVPGSGVGQPAYTAVGNFSDGTSESSIEQISSAIGASSRWKGMSGSTTGTIRMAASPDSGVSVIEHDSDADGVADQQIRLKVLDASSQLNIDSRFGSGPRQSTSMDGSFSHAQSRVATDIEDDGIPDIVIGARTEADSAVLRGYFERGDIPTQSQFANLLDSDGARSILSGMSGSTTGTIRMAASSDSAGSVCAWVQDDTPDGETVYATTRCDSTGTVSTWSQNDDADDFPNIKVRVDLKDEFGNSRGGMYLDQDSDNDGISDTEAELSCDESGARSILSGMSGSTTATIRMAASPDSSVFELGISGSTTGTIRIQTSSSGVANPIEHSSGAHLTIGGAWTNASDENLKENFAQVDGEKLLEKIEELPITQWNYKNEDESIVHIGPTAQDFKAAFGVGADNKSISTIDPSGIALAAIKELHKQNQDLTRQYNEMKKELLELKRKVNEGK